MRKVTTKEFVRLTPGIYPAKFEGFNFVDLNTDSVPFGMVRMDFTTGEGVNLEDAYPIPDWEAPVEGKKSHPADQFSRFFQNFFQEVFNCSQASFNEWVENTFYDENNNLKEFVYNAERFTAELNKFADELVAGLQADEKQPNLYGSLVVNDRKGFPSPYSYGFEAYRDDKKIYGGKRFPAFTVEEQTWEEPETFTNWKDEEDVAAVVIRGNTKFLLTNFNFGDEDGHEDEAPNEPSTDVQEPVTEGESPVVDNDDPPF